jgi:Immunoglobulin I-set domain/Lamin Tail Domain/Immunoglobulin domain
MKGNFMTKKFLTIFAIGVSAFFQAHAQLVITEVMSAEADGNHPDWWELTDFGTNTVDLTGYSWNDDSHGGFSGADSAPFTGIIIHPGESIIFTEQSTAITTPALFRSWWGISDTVQVVMLGSGDPGLGAGGDTVRLWSTNAISMGSATNGMDIDQAPDFLVDRVDMLGAPKGHSLICNTNNGLFGITNVVGVNGAFVAATTLDVGSPGIASTNAGPIVIVSQPTNLLVNVGAPAVFQITAFGLPKPRFQWLFNGVPVDPNVAQIVFTITNNYCRSTLTITNVQVANAGTFRVNVTNGFQPVVVSSNATLTVNTAPLAPVFTQTPSPTNLYAYLGQAITFTAGAFGNPPPGFQWQLNGTNISGQTDSQYVFNLSGTNQAGTYTVVATNSAGTNSASVVLIITPKPLLFITEVMSSESTNTDTGDSSNDSDWWELSNFGNFPVNIQGYRFDDNNFSLAQAATITNNVTIQPGESIILVEGMTPGQFRTWWGPQNLPPNLQIIKYPKIGFSATTDAVTLWNAATSVGNESDFIDSVGFGTAIRGDSFGFDPTQLDDDGFGGFSVAGINGAFVAAVGGDVGSPGTIVNVPNFTSFTKTGGGMALSWFTQPNWTNTVQFKNNLADPNWTTLTNILGDNTSTVNFVDPTTTTQRFYRVILKLNQ